MKISEETKKAITSRMLPPFCVSIDMAEILVRRFLQRQSFTLSQLPELTEEEGQMVLAYLEKTFANDGRQEIKEKVIKKIQDEREEEQV